MTEPELTSAVERAVQARIAAARRKAEDDQQRRAELAAARAVGLGYRHAAKLRRTATPPKGSATTPEKELPMPVTTPFRVVPCPSCRAQRTVRRVGTITISGSVYDVVRCPQAGCELLWCAHPERARPGSAAA